MKNYSMHYMGSNTFQISVINCFKKDYCDYSDIELIQLYTRFCDCKDVCDKFINYTR